MGQRQDEIIANDSQASICMIAKYMDSPQTLQQCKHKVMLEDIVAKLLARARKGLQTRILQTRILKVKSHIGIQGSEEADKLATAAIDSSKCSQEYAIGHEGLQSLYWPAQIVEKMSNDGDDVAEKWQAGDLTLALKKVVRSKCQAGNANTTLYVDLWNEVESKLIPNITEYLRTSPHTIQSILRNVPKARYGQLWNMNMAYVRKMPYVRELRTATSNASPLCSLEDLGSPFGGCRHQDIVKSYIARHNEAGRLILKAITKGTSGNNVFIADLGTQENMQANGSPRYAFASLAGSRDRHFKDAPRWRRGNRTADSLGITAPEDRLKMRPDTMVVDLTTNNLSEMESRAPKKRKADGELVTIRDMIGRKKITIQGLDT